MFDFNDATSDVKYKEIKRDTLIELADYINSTGSGDSNPHLTEAVYAEIVRMVGTNVFRTLPPHVQQEGPDADGDDEDPTFEVAWPHLQV